MFQTDKTNPRPGFHMTFKNGCTISVQWHYGSYADGRTNSNCESATAEIAIFDKDNNWYNFGDDHVKGYCTPDEVLEWMYFTAKFEGTFAQAE